MNNIENRIVEMKFDNAQFEAAVAKTMDTLDKFKQKLNFEGAGKGMDQLGKATGNYQYTLNDVGRSLEQLNSRFSTMGNIGRRVLENLTDSAYNFVSKGLGGMLSGITSGGLSRAMNLEQAKFQMQGIFKDAEKVRSVIYDDILPELQGTPYSLDQAAVVIGQLGASGIKASKDVRQATRAIAGLAAMSGHGFDEVGRIFSKVAGQGNMMGGELQQLSTYGINAAADIKNYFQAVEKGEAKASKAVKQHISEIIDAYGDLEEGTIRDAASKRMIYYKDMASAMDYLYGAHAKKSTEMYTGALEDLKAALARIGAEPAAVGLEFLRDAFNALVPAVDAVNAVLKPFTNATKDVIDTLGPNNEVEKKFGGAMYGTLAKEVQGLSQSFSKLFVRLDENGKILRWDEKSLAKFATTLTDADGVVHHFAVSGQEVAEGDAIMNPYMWRTITASTQTFVNILKALRSVIEPIAKGIVGAFPKLTLNTIANMAEAVRDFTSHLILSSENMERLRWITQGVFTPIGLVFRGLIALVKAFVKVMGTVFNTVAPALDAIFAFAASIGRIVSNFGDLAVDLANSGLELGKFVAHLITGIAQFLKLDKVLGVIQAGFLKLADLFDLAGAKIGGLIGNAVPKVRQFADSLAELVNLKQIGEHLKTLFDNIKNSVSKAFHLEGISNAFNDFIDSIKELASTDNLFGKILTNLKNFVKWVSELIPYGDIVDKVSVAFDNLATSISKITKKPAGAIRKFFQDRAKDVRDFITNLNAGNAFQVLAKSLIKPYATFKTWMTNLKVIILPLLKTLISYIPKLFGFVSFGEMMARIGEKIKGTITQLARFLGILGELTKDQTPARLAELRKGLEHFFGTTLTDKIIKMGKAISDGGSGFATKLVELGHKVGEALRNLDETTVRKLVTSLALLALAWKYIGVMRSAKWALEGYAKAFSSIGNLFNSFNSAFGLKTINMAIAKSIKLISLAASLVLFASAVYILSKMDWKQMVVASAIILSALVAFWEIMRAMDLLEATVKNTSTIRTLAVYMAGLGAGVLMIALAVKEVAEVWKSSSPDQALAAVLSIIAIMGAFGMLSTVLGGIDGNAKSLGKASFALIGIAQGMKMMAEAFTVFGGLDQKSFERGLSSVSALMLMFALFAAAVRPGAKVFSAAAGLMEVAAAMYLMHEVLSKFGNLKPAVIERGGKALAAILLALTAFAGVAGAAEKSIFAAGAGMIAIAGAIFVIASAMERIGNFDPGVFKQGFIAIAAMLAAFVLFAKFAGSGGALGAGGAVLALAAGIFILIGAIQALAMLDFGKLLYGLFNMELVVGSLAIAIAVLNGALKLIGAKDALKVTLLGTGLFFLANAIGILAALPITFVALAILGLVGAMAAVGAVMFLFSGISPAMLAVGAAFALLGVSALFVGAGLLFLTTALTTLIPLLLTLSFVDMNTLAKGLEVIKMVATGLSDAFIALAKGVTVFGLACIVAGLGLIAIGGGLLLIAAGAVLASVGVALLAGALALLAITIQKFFGSDLLSIVNEGFEAFAGGFTGIFSKLWDKIVGTSGTKAKETRTAIDNGLMDGSGDSGVQDSIEKGPKDALNDLANMGPTDFKNAGIDLNNQLGFGFTENGNPLDMTGFSNQFGMDISQLQTASYDGGLGAMSNFAQGELDGKVDVDAATKLVSGGIGKNLGKGDFSAFGLAIPTSIAAGENKGKSNVTTVTKKVEDAAKPKSQYQAGYDVGSGVTSGIVSGIKKGIDAVARAAWSAGNTAATKAKQGANVNSPSKKTIPVGEAICEGIVVGIDRMRGAVKTAAFKLGDDTTNYVGTAMASIAKAFDSDVDFNPTIAPVVDLTNVRKGATDINSMFSNPAFGLSTPYNNYISAQMAARSFNERGNSSDFEAIAKLANEIGLMTESMNSRQMINNIQIDGSEDPNAFADALTRRFKLNARTM